MDIDLSDTSGGAEVDLVNDLGAGELWAIEIKRRSAPRGSGGFHSACQGLRPARKIIVHAGDESYPLRPRHASSPVGALTILGGGRRRPPGTLSSTPRQAPGTSACATTGAGVRVSNQDSHRSPHEGDSAERRRDTERGA